MTKMSQYYRQKTIETLGLPDQAPVLDGTRRTIALIDPVDGTVFGEGHTRQECIDDAVLFAFHDDNVPCTQEWILEQVSEGNLALKSFRETNEADMNKTNQQQSGVFHTLRFQKKAPVQHPGVFHTRKFRKA